MKNTLFALALAVTAAIAGCAAPAALAPQGAAEISSPIADAMREPGAAHKQAH